MFRVFLLLNMVSFRFALMPAKIFFIVRKCHADFKNRLHGCGGRAYANGALPRAARRSHARRHIRRSDEKRSAGFPALARPDAGRHIRRGERARARALASRVCRAHDPSRRHALLARRAVRRLARRDRNGKPGARPVRAAARTEARRTAAVFRRADGYPVVQRAYGLCRGRADAPVSAASRRKHRAERPLPPGVGAHRGRRAAPRALQRRAPRERVDHDAAFDEIYRDAPSRRRRGRDRVRISGGGHSLSRRAHARAARRSGRRRSCDRRAAGGRSEGTRGGHRRGLPRDPLPGRLEGEHRGRRSQFAVPRRVGHRPRDQVCAGIRPPRAARLCRRRAAYRARERRARRVHRSSRPRARPRVPHAGQRYLLEVLKF